MSTLKEIQEQIETLKKRADEIRKTEIPKVVAEIQEKMKQYGIAVDDIAPKAGQRHTSKHSPVAVKYRGPNGETWTGRGMAPVWLRTLIESGQPKSSFEV